MGGATGLKDQVDSGKFARHFQDALGVIKDIKGYVHEDMFVHEHEGENGATYDCHDPTCNFWIWNHPEIAGAIPPEFAKMLHESKDFHLLIIVMLVITRRDLKVISGPVMRLPLINKRVRILKIIALIVSAAGLFGAGAFFDETTLHIIKGILS